MIFISTDTHCNQVLSMVIKEPGVSFCHGCDEFLVMEQVYVMRDYPLRSPEPSTQRLVCLLPIGSSSVHGKCGPW